MNIIKARANVFGVSCALTLMDFKKSDGGEWKKLFDKWRDLKMGMRDYKAREPNIPEGLTEVAFCLFSGSKRFIGLTGNASASFDTFNLETGKAEQIKASSIEDDLSSFGPRSKWDDLYFLDFYSGGKLDGTFDVYKIPTDLIHSANMNKSESFLQQQNNKRRPRFSIKKNIILKNKIKPIGKNIKVW